MLNNMGVEVCCIPISALTYTYKRLYVSAEKVRNLHKLLLPYEGNFNNTSYTYTKYTSRNVYLNSCPSLFRRSSSYFSCFFLHFYGLYAFINFFVRDYTAYVPRNYYNKAIFDVKLNEVKTEHRSA